MYQNNVIKPTDLNKCAFKKKDSEKERFKSRHEPDIELNTRYFAPRKSHNAGLIRHFSCTGAAPQVKQITQGKSNFLSTPETPGRMQNA